MKDKDPFDRFSARIKNLYIELNEYAYFHSPSEIGRIDRRFTGRTRILKRLKSLFTDYETPSGAYLVTGYRGAGKSSLVARALSEVSSASGASRRESRLLRLLVPILPLSLLGGLFDSHWMWVLVGGLALLLLVYLLWTDPKFPGLLERSEHRDVYLIRLKEVISRYLRPTYPKSSNAEPRYYDLLRLERWRSLVRCFFLGEESSPRSQFRLLAQDFFIVCCMILLTEGLLLLSDNPSFGRRFATYLAVLAFFLVLNFLAAVLLARRHSEDLDTESSISVHLQELLALPFLCLAIEMPFEMLGVPWRPLRFALYFVFCSSAFLCRFIFEGAPSPTDFSGPKPPVPDQTAPHESAKVGEPLPRLGLSKSVLLTICISFFWGFFAWKGLPFLATLDSPEIMMRLVVPAYIFVTSLLVSWIFLDLLWGLKRLRTALLHPFLPGLTILRHFWKRFKDYIRYSNRVFIKINLSQDDIREIDILRLIAKNVYLKYKEFNTSWRTDLHWKVVRIFMLLLVVGLIYNFKTVYLVNCAIKHELHLACFFPSQGAFYLQGGIGTYRKEVRRGVERGQLDSLSLRQRLEKRKKSEIGKRLEAEIDIRREGHSSSTVYLTHPLFDHGAVADNGGLTHRILHLVMELSGACDLFVQDMYDRFYRSLPDEWRAIRFGQEAQQGEGQEAALSTAPPDSRLSWLSLQGVQHEIRLIPASIDYLFLVYLLGTWFALGFLFRWPSIGLVSHRQILRRLEELNEMIESRVTREKGILPAPTGALFAINFGRRESRTSPNLTERDIEKYLLEILFLIERIPRLTVRPEFIIIFDELDKIQHQENYTLVEKEEQQEEEFQGREFASVEAERERQHRILSLVSNLKHFLTTAPAKFIFIAGREMFDASLADISDRHFFMGSVFNEVLHVPSFHSDDSDGRLPNITSLTEQYLCRFLLPRTWWRRGLDLRTFRTYLEEDLWPDPPGGCEVGGLEAREREKLLYELHNFITYLTYRSNGAPKKITRTMERFLTRFEHSKLDDPDNLVFGRSSRSLYLRFSYYDQYTFGLVTYLGGPLIFSLNRAIKDYGDKILVSSSFLLDHVYKFHGSGFSWRNLELLPEIVDINRAPQLRELITNIMRFLAKSDISEIVSGLYDFKFTRRITEEIAFLSKISEEESAAFNFTLDESLAIKRHFNRKLHKLLDTYKDYPNAGDEKFVNSIAFVRMILGDLHYYDGELDSAIIEYMEAVQALRNIDTDNIRIDTLVLMVRNFLKLGLAFERKKSYESSFVTYGRISAMLTQIGERSRQGPGDWWKDPSRRKWCHKSEQIFSQTAFEGIRLIYQPMFARLQLIEKSTLGGITKTDIDNVLEEFGKMLSPRQAKERFLIEGEFKNKLADILYFKNGPRPQTENEAYCCKNQGTLCGRNPHWEALAIGDRRRLPCSACAQYHDALSGLCRSFLGLEPQELTKKPWPKILAALEKGRENADRENSLKELAGTFSDLGNTFLSCSKDLEIDERYAVGLLGLLGEHITRARAIELTKELNLLDDEGRAYPTAVEALVSLSRGQTGRLAVLLQGAKDLELDPAGRYLLEQKLRDQVGLGTSMVRRAISQSARSIKRSDIAQRIQRLRPFPSKELSSALDELGARRGRSHGPNKLEEALTCYVIAALLFQSAANSRACGRELAKVLWLLRELIAVGGRGVGDDLRKMIKKVLVPETIRQNYMSHEGTHRLEIEQLKEVLETEKDPRPFIESVNLGRLSISASVIESLAVTDEIEMDLSTMKEVIPLDRRCSPHAMFHSVFARIHSLRYRSRAHYKNLSILDVFYEDDRRRFERLPTIDEVRPIFHQELPEERKIEGEEVLEFMIADSIYCCHEIIRFLAIYGTSYMASHSMRAAAHRNLALWCDLYYNYLRDYTHLTGRQDRMPAVRRLEEQLRRMVGKADMVDLSPNFHAEMALRHHEAAKQAHSEGKAYSELIEGMYYLTDDFADQLEHFCAGLERFRINSGAIDRDIRRLRHRLATTAIYEADRYEDAGGAAGKKRQDSPPQSKMGS